MINTITITIPFHQRQHQRIVAVSIAIPIIIDPLVDRRQRQVQLAARQPAAFARILADGLPSAVPLRFMSLLRDPSWACAAHQGARQRPALHWRGGGWCQGASSVQ